MKKSVMEKPVDEMRVVVYKGGKKVCEYVLMDCVINQERNIERDVMHTKNGPEPILFQADEFEINIHGTGFWSRQQKVSKK